jgi:transposase
MTTFFFGIADSSRAPLASDGHTRTRAPFLRVRSRPVRSVFIQDPLSGHLYVFFSRRCDRVRIIYWDRNGFAMWTKRLERGRFQAPVDGSALSLKVLEAAELGMILDGLEFAGARRRPRWEPGARAV